MDIVEKRILITGGKGYLGTHLASHLASLGATVFTTDIIDCDDKLYFKADITNKNELQNVIDAIQPEIVFHLAALIDRTRSFSNMEKMLKVNQTGTQFLIQSLASVKYSTFVYVSSSEVYGDQQAPFSETMAPRPASPYSLTKLMGEYTVSCYSNINNMPYSIVRLFNFFGPNMPEQFFIPQMIATLKNKEIFKMTKGEQLRDFLYLDDVLEGLVHIANSPNLNGKTVNLCSGEATSLEELAMFAAELTGSIGCLDLGAVPYRPNEVWNMQGDSTRLWKSGFEHRYSVKEGIALLIKANNEKKN